MSEVHRRLILPGLLLTMGSACLPISRWLGQFDDVAHLWASEWVWWAIVAATLLYVSRVERLPLSSIGLRPPGVLGIFLGVVAGVLILAALATVIYGVFPVLGLRDDPAMAKLMAVPFGLRVAAVTRAAIAEEIVFRGYGIERLEALTGSRIAAASLSCAIFTLDHLGGWGPTHLIVVGIAGIALTLLYLWRRNLWVTIIAHWIIDGTAFLVD